jgi:hypothetical protein
MAALLEKYEISQMTNSEQGALSNAYQIAEHINTHHEIEVIFEKKFAPVLIC